MNWSLDNIVTYIVTFTVLEESYSGYKGKTVRVLEESLAHWEQVLVLEDYLAH